MRSIPSSLIYLLAVLAGCGDDNDADTGADDASDTMNGEGSDGSESGTTAGPTAHAVRGTVTRLESLTIWDGNDGVGTLYLAALPECADGVAPTAVGVVPDADLAAADAAVPFAIEGAQTGSHFLGVFLDDDLDAALDAPAPDQGDLALANGVVMGCVEVEVAGADVTDVEVVLNFVLPF